MTDENDQIVPTKSTLLKGATVIRVKGMTELNIFQHPLTLALAALKAHGEATEHPKVASAVGQELGKSLAVPLGKF